MRICRGHMNYVLARLPLPFAMLWKMRGSNVVCRLAIVGIIFGTMGLTGCTKTSPTPETVVIVSAPKLDGGITFDVQDTSGLVIEKGHHVEQHGEGKAVTISRCELYSRDATKESQIVASGDGRRKVEIAVDTDFVIEIRAADTYSFEASIDGKVVTSSILIVDGRNNHFMLVSKSPTVH